MSCFSASSCSFLYLMHCVSVNTPKPRTAAKALRRAGTVLERAVAVNLCTDNPARAVARAAATLEARADPPDDLGRLRGRAAGVRIQRCRDGAVGGGALV